MPTDQAPLPAEATQGLEPKVVKVAEELSCKLNQVEWENKARDLAEAHREVARQEERKKTVSAGLTNDVKIAKAKESKLADIVASREEQREVTVEVKYDYELGKVIKTRTDTDEVITERDMTDSERHEQLELVSANDFIEGRHNDDKPTDPFADDDAADSEQLEDEEVISDGPVDESEPETEVEPDAAAEESIVDDADDDISESDLDAAEDADPPQEEDDDDAPTS